MFWAGSPKATPLPTSVSPGTTCGDVEPRAGTPLLPLGSPWGAAALPEPQREQLVMSKSCQEKSQIPPMASAAPLRGAAGWQMVAASSSAGGWDALCCPARARGCVSAGSPGAGGARLHTGKRGSVINLPGDRCLSPSCLCRRQSREEPGDTAFSCLPGQGSQAILHPSPAGYRLAGG